MLPEARLAYRTFGSPDAPRGAVLIPSNFIAGSADNDFLIGDGLALDPAEFFVIATELLGNGVSSSPSNTPPPFDGPRFAVTTIRDAVELIRRLLVKELGVEHRAAVVGFSMGAMQALQLAVNAPGFVDRVVTLAGTARCYPHGVAQLDGELAAHFADSAFAEGDYTKQPATGLGAFGTVCSAWLYSQQWWRDELWREVEPKTSFDTTMAGFRDDFLPSANANDVVPHCRTWQQHDVGTTPDFDGVATSALLTVGDPRRRGTWSSVAANLRGLCTCWTAMALFSCFAERRERLSSTRPGFMHQRDGPHRYSEPVRALDIRGLDRSAAVSAAGRSVLHSTRLVGPRTAASPGGGLQTLPEALLPSPT